MVGAETEGRLGAAMGGDAFAELASGSGSCITLSTVFFLSLLLLLLPIPLFSLSCVWLENHMRSSGAWS